ncbi:glycosaminoglycan xylosylkinase-like [Clavelina lepadiformis]|uniref:glycosaminoglycan xylosylkinase-like n=1 Tax=Clavelina lepadiformis TaxID=159417 RepID=UPI00404118A9
MLLSGILVKLSRLIKGKMKLKERVALGTFLMLLVIYVFLLTKNRKKESKFTVWEAKIVHEDSLDKFQQEPKAELKVEAAVFPKQQQKDSKEEFISNEINRLRLEFKDVQIDDVKNPFKVAASWVNERQIYPSEHPEMSAILKTMSTAKIIHADALPKGTQIKLLLSLEGGQKVVFKQKRYERDYVITGKPYDGYDRHNAEIAAFHLDRILDFRRAPLVVGRTINLRLEIMPVATERLLKTFREENGNICYFGICLYCKEKEMACADGDIMEGAVVLWLPDEWSVFQKQRHPYQRTYVDGRYAQWEKDETYCNRVVKKTVPYDRGSRLLDVTDGTVFDYLIGNADRHHYETFKDHGSDVMIIMMDNAKSFGNPFHHESSILAPLRQCCILRNSTCVRMKQLQNGVLTLLLEEVMSNDPIAPILHPSHLNAIDIRLTILLETVEKCIKEHSKEKVLLEKWDGI